MGRRVVAGSQEEPISGVLKGEEEQCGVCRRERERERERERGNTVVRLSGAKSLLLHLLTNF
jgi:hypothetical protein